MVPKCSLVFEALGSFPSSAAHLGNKEWCTLVEVARWRQADQFKGHHPQLQIQYEANPNYMRVYFRF